EPKLKHEVEEILQRLGLTASDAIDLFYRQIRQNKGIPFQVKIPNATTRKTMQETDEGKNLVLCDSADDLFTDLLSEPKTKKQNLKRFAG
ncbi:MAG: type II toxin-antitoxin system RelB/DinJ family antitoxin, partial [Bacteroidales bacterium]|nr:type II toxin-antitoxin system RelB/DinJ family antitoxin [Bacteroidales bacterium]